MVSIRSFCSQNVICRALNSCFAMLACYRHWTWKLKAVERFVAAEGAQPFVSSVVGNIAAWPVQPALFAFVAGSIAV